MLKMMSFLGCLLLLMLCLGVPSAWSAWVVNSGGYLITFTLFLIPAIIISEVFVFWLWANKILQIQIKFLKLLLVVLVANCITGIGKFFYTFISDMGYSDLTWISVFFIGIVLIEWGIYTHFRKIIKIFDLLKISFIGNLLSLGVAVLFGVVLTSHNDGHRYEAPTNLAAIQMGEEAYKLANGTYLDCAASPRAVKDLDGTTMPWQDLGTGFTGIDFAPFGKVRFIYQVSRATTTGFVVEALGVDKNGNRIFYVATESIGPHLFGTNPSDVELTLSLGTTDDTQGPYFVRGRLTQQTLSEIQKARIAKSLIEALKDKNWIVRWKAVEASGKIKTVEPLIEALKDEMWSVRESAAVALGEIKDARAVEPLIAALKDKSSDFRIAALEDKSSVVRWRADVRWRAAEALGEIKDTRAVEPLIEALKDERLVVRRRAAEALGKIKDTRAVEPLIEALKAMAFK